MKTYEKVNLNFGAKNNHLQSKKSAKYMNFSAKNCFLKSIINEIFEFSRVKNQEFDGN